MVDPGMGAVDVRPMRTRGCTCEWRPFDSSGPGRPFLAHSTYKTIACRDRRCARHGDEAMGTALQMTYLARLPTTDAPSDQGGET